MEFVLFIMLAYVCVVSTIHGFDIEKIKEQSASPPTSGKKSVV